MADLSFMDNIIEMQDLFLQLPEETRFKISIVILFMSALITIITKNDESLENIFIWEGAVLSVVAGLLVALDFIQVYAIMPPAALLFFGLLLKGMR